MYKYNKDMEPYVVLIIIIIVALLLGGLYVGFPNAGATVLGAVGLTAADLRPDPAVQTRANFDGLGIGGKLAYCVKANRGTVAATAVWLILSIVTLFLIGSQEGDKMSMFFLEFILMILVPAAIALRGAMKAPSTRATALAQLKAIYPDIPRNPTDVVINEILAEFDQRITTAQAALARLVAAATPANLPDRTRLQNVIATATSSRNRFDATARRYIGATAGTANATGEQCTEFLTTDFLKTGGLITWAIVAVITLTVLWSRAGNAEANTAISAVLIFVVPLMVWYRGMKSGQSGGARDASGGSGPSESKIAQAGLFALAAALVALGGVFLVKEASQSELIGAAAKYIAYAGAGGIGAIALYRLFKKYSGNVSLGGLASIEALMEGVPFGVKFLLLEILGVAIVAAYPTARKKLLTIAMPRGAKVFLDDPVPLDKSTNVDAFSDLTGTLPKSYPYSPMYNYSVGGWFFFDNVAGNGPLPKTTGYVPILDFGGSPLVTFNPGTAHLKVVAEIAGGGKATLYDDIVPLQRWNNIVVTFDQGTADVLINNTLVGTRKNTTPMQTRGPLSVGYKIPGESSVRGGVTKVFFSPKPMNRFISGLNYRLMAPSQGV